MMVSQILRQAWPVLIGAWASIAFGVIDTAMAGHASAADLQAMTLSVSIYITVFVGLMGVVHALIPIIAQHYGAGRWLEVGRAWGQGIWLALGLSVVGAFIMAFPDAWLSVSKGAVSDDVRSGVTWYLRALILALPATLAFRAVYALGTATSRPKIVMSINLVGVLVKAALNWLFIFGKLGLPALGATGAGLSTAITAWLSLAAGLVIVRHDRFFRKFKLHLPRPQWAAQKVLLRLGLPMGGSYLLEVCAFSVMALLIAREGMFASGGHQIIANLTALCYMMPMAVSMASASLTAQAIGAQDLARARATGRAGYRIVLCGALLTALAVWLGRGLIVNSYTNDAQVAAQALALITVVPFFHLFDALHCVGNNLLRAYKVAVVPLLLQASSLTGIGLVGGWLLGFGPGADWLGNWTHGFLPDAPGGAATLWLMSVLGMAVATVLIRLWYLRVVRHYGGKPTSPAKPADVFQQTP